MPNSVELCIYHDKLPDASVYCIKYNTDAYSILKQT